MAVSFIASGIVWRWLMNPAPGDRSSGLNVVFEKLAVGFLANHWWQHPELGMAAMAIPAIWALSGYIMALYLAGFRGVPEELREAARMDGASEWRVYRHVVFLHLRPVTLSALIILGHISMKVFDLIVAIGGKQIVTEVPAVYMWVLIYDARDYAKGAAIATLLLVGISVLIVPYLVYTVRRSGAHDDRRARRASYAPLAPLARRTPGAAAHGAVQVLRAARSSRSLILMPVYVLLVTSFKSFAEIDPSHAWSLPSIWTDRRLARGLGPALALPRQQLQARDPRDGDLDGPRLAERVRPLEVALPRRRHRLHSSCSSGCSSRTRR